MLQDQKSTIQQHGGCKKNILYGVSNPYLFPPKKTKFYLIYKGNKTIFYENICSHQGCPCRDGGILLVNGKSILWCKVLICPVSKDRTLYTGESQTCAMTSYGTSSHLSAILWSLPNALIQTKTISPALIAIQRIFLS